MKLASQLLWLHPLKPSCSCQENFTPAPDIHQESGNSRISWNRMCWNSIQYVGNMVFQLYGRQYLVFCLSRESQASPTNSASKLTAIRAVPVYPYVSISALALVRWVLQPGFSASQCLRRNPERYLNTCWGLLSGCFNSQISEHHFLT